MGGPAEPAPENTETVPQVGGDAGVTPVAAFNIPGLYNDGRQLFARTSDVTQAGNGAILANGFLNLGDGNLFASRTLLWMLDAEFEPESKMQFWI